MASFQAMKLNPKQLRMLVFDKLIRMCLKALPMVTIKRKFGRKQAFVNGFLKKYREMLRINKRGLLKRLLFRKLTELSITKYKESKSYLKKYSMKE